MIRSWICLIRERWLLTTDVQKSRMKHWRRFKTSCQALERRVSRSSWMISQVDVRRSQSNRLSIMMTMLAIIKRLYMPKSDLRSCQLFIISYMNVSIISSGKPDRKFKIGSWGSSRALAAEEMLPMTNSMLNQANCLQRLRRLSSRKVLN